MLELCDKDYYRGFILCSKEVTILFNVRFGYYLGAICIFPIILWYDGIKNTLFRKNNTRLHILSGMIGILIITLPAIFLIFNLPPTYNRIIKTVTGEVVKRQCNRNGLFKWSGSIFNYT